MRALRSGNGRRGSYHRCAARATQAIPGAGGCTLELLGWWSPPEHQETPLDATRAARVSVPAGAHSFTRPRSGASRLGLTRSRLWSRLPASPGTLVVRGSPAAPTPMQEHLGWPVWLLQRNCYNLRGGVTRAPRAHAPATARNRLLSRLAASPGALVVNPSPSAPAPMQEHLGWPVWLLQRNYNLRVGRNQSAAPGARTDRRDG